MEPNVKHLILPGFPWSTSACILRDIYMCSSFTRYKRWTPSPLIHVAPQRRLAHVTVRGNTLLWFLVFGFRMYIL